MQIKSFGFGVLGILLIIPQMTLAVNTQVVREECYNTLKQNITETGIFKEAEKEFADLSYVNLETRLSRSYKNLSSFGIELDKPLFEQKMYSFGEQTGYVHPPFSPFPIYTKSDKWETPAKQNIFSEEYIRDEKGQLHFLSCGFIRIDSKNLKEVTSENYLYDGELISVLKTEKNEEYKAWYSENPSYNHEDELFVNWKRLFVYPASSINSYFNRFNIAESFPSNSSDTLDLFIPNKKKDEAKIEGSVMMKMYVRDADGRIKSSAGPEVLKPKTLPGNRIFGLNSYYQAIENYFPNFAKNLALQGTLKYETLKKVLVREDADELAYLWSTVLDPRKLTIYAHNKTKNDDIPQVDFYEKSLKNIDKFESIANQALEIVEERIDSESSVKKITLKGDLELKKENNIKNKSLNPYFMGTLLLILLLVLAIFGIKKLKK